MGSIGSMGSTEGILCISCLLGQADGVDIKELIFVTELLPGGIERPKEILAGAVP